MSCSTSLYQPEWLHSTEVAEGDAIVAAIKEVAESGCNIVAITDDAYFGLFYEDSLKESLFGKLANLHPRILAVKLDGATKEEFVWGFRTGFITFADGNEYENTPVMTALEKKTMGIIRARISNRPQLLPDLRHRGAPLPEIPEQKEEKFHVLKGQSPYIKKARICGTIPPGPTLFNSPSMCLPKISSMLIACESYLTCKVVRGVLAGIIGDLRTRVDAFSWHEEK